MKNGRLSTALVSIDFRRLELRTMLETLISLLPLILLPTLHEKVSVYHIRYLSLLLQSWDKTMQIVTVG